MPGIGRDAGADGSPEVPAPQSSAAAMAGQPDAALLNRLPAQQAVAKPHSRHQRRGTPPGGDLILIDGTDTGRVFDGIGAISGGAVMRLLVDYPPAQRQDILDYLFRPDFGAGFQRLKVEIGADIYTTDGVEPSYARTRDEFLNPTAATFNRGYEWWLMEQAKARNPNITLSALEWGAPAWIGTGSDRQRFFSQDNIDYILQFVNGAQTYHNLRIDYVGVWNEEDYDVPWIKALRAAVDRNNADHGLATRIVANDGIADDWAIADDMLRDPELARAVDVVGHHYTSWGEDYKSTQAAQDTGKPLWDSEDGPWWIDEPWSGNWHLTEELARTYNRNYVSGLITGIELWPPITAYYDNLPVRDGGPLKANTPWSGHYDVGPGVWVTAHTTQFAQPGWQYLDTACDFFGDNPDNPIGSYVTLRSPNQRDYSIIVETTGSDERIDATFQVSGGLSAEMVQVWRTNSTSSFVRLSDIRPGLDGVFHVTFDGHSIYSLTTTTGQSKGTAAAVDPAPSPFPLPYNQDFEGYPLGATVPYLTDQGGAFEVAASTTAKGQVYRQVTTTRGIQWAGLTPDPFTFLGDPIWPDFPLWTDYRASVSAYIGDAPSPSAYMAILGRIKGSGWSPTYRIWPNCYHFTVDKMGNWVLQRTYYFPDPERYEVVELGSGTLPAFDPTVWHQLALDFRGTTITALVDGAQVRRVTDSFYRGGMAGFGSGLHIAEFDDFSIS